MSAGISLSGSAVYPAPHAMSEFYGMYITDAEDDTGSGCCILLEDNPTGCILLEEGDCGVAQLEVPKLQDNEQLAYPEDYLPRVILQLTRSLNSISTEVLSTELLGTIIQITQV